jgi:ABC-type Na+ efflux pump permease subunit
MYTAATQIELKDSRFITFHAEPPEGRETVKKEYADVYLGFDGTLYVITSGSKKSLAATEELIKAIRSDFEEFLYQRYGKKAYPVFVRAVYVDRGHIATPSGTVNLEEVRKAVERGETEVGKPKEKSGIPEHTPEPKIPSGGEKRTFDVGKLIFGEKGYTTPSTFSPPSLMGKMIYAFLLILPSYFAIQVYSSSFIEDRFSGRLVSLLSTPLSPRDILLGKMLPYFLLSTSLVLFSSILLANPSSALYILPPLLFLFSIQTLFALLSRSYKEMTFLILVSSLVITGYLFIPAIFAGTVPFSKVSPITLLLSNLEGETVTLREYFVSTLQFFAAFIFISLICVRALDAEFLEYQGGIVERFLEACRRVVTGYPSLIAYMGLSIAPIFMVEFMLATTLFAFPLHVSIPFFLMTIAAVEEFFKTVALHSAIRNGLEWWKAGVVGGITFLIFEKLLVVVDAGIFSNAMMAGMLVLPLALHVSTLLLFSYLIRLNPKGYWLAYVAATLLHFAYNLGVVTFVLA